MLGGVCGLVGTSLLGPRSGIFDKATVNKLVKQANKKRVEFEDEDYKYSNNANGQNSTTISSIMAE